MEQTSLFGESWHREDLPRRAPKAPNRSDQPPPQAGIQMVLGEESGCYRTDPGDGMIARVIQPHSLEKAYYVSRYADIVGTALGRYEVWWVELFAGPGRLWVAPERRFADGSPLDALRIRRPFKGYFFSDLDRDCTQALVARIAGLHPNITIATGSANDSKIHQAVIDTVPQHAVVMLYLDPEGIDVHFETIERFARHYPRIDLLLNFPASGAARVLGTGYTGRVEALVGDGSARLTGAGTGAQRIRMAFYEQLDELGFRYRSSQQVSQRRNRSVLYDLMLASRKPLGRDLFEKAAAVRPDGQRTLDLGI